MDSDVYRGPPPEPAHNIDSASTTSSESSFLGLRRLGAITSTLEQAIARWARINRSTTSSSSSSSNSSVRQRRRRSSFQTEISDFDFTARITLMKAREESRQVPRSFVLYLPPELYLRTSFDTNKRVLHTSSLPDVLNQLETVLKRSSRKNQDRKQGEAPTSHVLDPLHKIPSRPASFTDLGVLRKPRGKQKDVVAADAPAPKAWFLDVASPTSADMQAIAKLLHLHPLTLEDILHQDPREKMEHFPKLGYYFVSFRTLANGAMRQRFRSHTIQSQDTLYDQGVLGEANIYLVVFKEGICTFHFTDIHGWIFTDAFSVSKRLVEHIEGVLNRIVQLEEVLNMSSDWIAHGILDSIVDSLSFFLQEIDKEVTSIEELVFAGDSRDLISDATASKTLIEPEPEFSNEKQPSSHIADKEGYFDPPVHMTTKIFRSLSRISELLSVRRASRTGKPKRLSAPNTSLHRMARIRRLVTSLGRLLATKSEVIAQLRKRLLTGGISKADDTEVAIYMGDVQDHILTMQHALSHYERMLSQSHPIYLSQLRTTVSKTKAGTDQALIILTIVSIAVLCIQTVIGLFSLNVTVPSNPLVPQAPYHVFGIVLALSCLVLATYLAVVRRWWLQAKKRRKTAVL